MKEFDDLKFYGIKNRQSYLENTDWVIIRDLEKNIAIPIEISDKREQARQEISLLRDSTSYDEIKHLTIEFN